jgi:hypothetical protein
LKPYLAAGISLDWAYPLRVSNHHHQQNNNNVDCHLQSHEILSAVRPLQILGTVFTKAIRNERIISHLVFSPTTTELESKNPEEKNSSTSSKYHRRQQQQGNKNNKNRQQEFASLPLCHAICYDIPTHRAVEMTALKIDDNEIVGALMMVNRSSVSASAAVESDDVLLGCDAGERAPSLVRHIASKKIPFIQRGIILDAVSAVPFCVREGNSGEQLHVNNK